MATLRNTVVSTNLITSLGATPANGDNVIIDRSAIDYIAGTNLSAADLDLFELTPGFAGSFSAELGGALQLVVNDSGAGRFVNRSRARRIDLRSTSITGVIARIVQDGAGSLLAITECKPASVEVLRGSMVIGQNTDVAAVFQSGGTCTVRPDTNAITGTYTITGGEASIARDLAALNQVGGVTTLDSPTITASGTITLSGGTMFVRQLTSGATFLGEAGVLDLTQMAFQPVFTNSTHWPGLTIRLARGQSEPTWGTLTEPYGAAKREYV